MYNFLKAGKKDIPLIRALTFKVWPQTYAAILTREQIGYMLDRMYSASSLEKQMNEGSEFIIIVNNNEPVGFAAYFRYEETVYKLDKIYILTTEQGKGTGKALLEQVIKNVKEKGALFLRLNVNRHNKAKGFYEKYGFTVVAEGDFDIGNGFFMNDYIMEKKLG
jgi:GNAT superfamily N-acetyltransferase